MKFFLTLDLKSVLTEPVHQGGCMTAVSYEQNVFCTNDQCLK